MTQCKTLRVSIRKHRMVLGHVQLTMDNLHIVPEDVQGGDVDMKGDRDDDTPGPQECSQMTRCP